MFKVGSMPIVAAYSRLQCCWASTCAALQLQQYVACHTQSMLRLAATSLTVCNANMAVSNAIKMQSRPPPLRGCKDAPPKQCRMCTVMPTDWQLVKPDASGRQKSGISVYHSLSLSRSLLAISQMVAPNIQIVLRDDAQMICCLRSRKAFLSRSPLPLSSPIIRMLSLLSFVQ